jgi:hypothetical protein
MRIFMRFVTVSLLQLLVPRKHPYRRHDTRPLYQAILFTLETKQEKEKAPVLGIRARHPKMSTEVLSCNLYISD